MIGNAGTLVVFRVGSRDAELLAPEFRPMDAGALADQEPSPRGCAAASAATGSSRSQSCIEPLGTAELIREQSRQRFGRSRAAIERQRRMRF